MNDFITITKDELFDIFALWINDYYNNPDEFLSENDYDDFDLQTITEETYSYFFKLLNEVRNIE